VLLTITADNMGLSIALIEFAPLHFITVMLVWTSSIMLNSFIDIFAAVLQQVNQLEVVTVYSVSKVTLESITVNQGE